MHIYRSLIMYGHVMGYALAWAVGGAQALSSIVGDW